MFKRKRIVDKHPKLDIPLGYNVQNEHFWPLNLFLIIARQYIFSCVRNKERINIFRLQQIAKEKFDEQESLANTKWSRTIIFF